MKTAACRHNGMTLFELLIAMALLGVLVLYFTALEQIGRQDVMAVDRRVKVQNEAVYALEHISKNLLNVIGSATMGENGGSSGASINPIYISDQGAKKRRIKFVYDYNGGTPNGAWDGIGGGDRVGCYQIRESSNTVAYDPDAGDMNQYKNNGACSATEVLSDHITDIVTVPDTIQVQPFNLGQNWIELSVTACYNPAATCAQHSSHYYNGVDIGSSTCGDIKHPENPAVTVTTRITMPMVSVQ